MSAARRTSTTPLTRSYHLILQALLHWPADDLRKELVSRGMPSKGAKRSIVKVLAKPMFEERRSSIYDEDRAAAAHLAKCSKRGGNAAAAEALQFAIRCKWWSEIEKELNAFYSSVNKDKLPGVPGIVKSLHGDRRQLNTALFSKYGHRLLTVAAATAAMSAKAESFTRKKTGKAKASRAVLDTKAPAAAKKSRPTNKSAAPAAKRSRHAAPVLVKPNTTLAAMQRGRSNRASTNGMNVKAQLEALLGAPAEPLKSLPELEKMIQKRTAAELKVELAARDMRTTGLKKVLVERLAKVMFDDAAANGARRGYTWWSDVEKELHEYFKIVDEVCIFHEHVWV